MFAQDANVTVHKQINKRSVLVTKPSFFNRYCMIVLIKDLEYFSRHVHRLRRR